MNLREFSSGYYTLDMLVQSYEAGPVIEQDLYDYIDQRVYAQTNTPVTMKISMHAGEYFSVDAEAAVPTDVLALPAAWIENFGPVEAGARTRVFVLKPGYSHVVSS